MKKKKRLWYLMGLVFALFMMILIPGNRKSFAGELSPVEPSPNQCKVGMRNYGTLTVPLKAKGDRIGDIKVYSGTKGSEKTTNLVAKYWRSDYYEKNTADIIYYAKKAGSYRIKYTVVGKSGKERTTEVVKVYASSTEPAGIGISIDGKRIDFSEWDSDRSCSLYTAKKSAKVKFSAAPGCKIKKIEMRYLLPDLTTTMKKISNGSKVMFSTRAIKFQDYSGFQLDSFAETLFVVYYTDSYSLDKSKVYNTRFSIMVPAAEWVNRNPQNR